MHNQKFKAGDLVVIARGEGSWRGTSLAVHYRQGVRTIHFFGIGTIGIFVKDFFDQANGRLCDLLIDGKVYEVQVGLLEKVK